ncbi:MULTISPECIES: response regulator transcription factor [Paenibacillus]|uniref:Response regulator transcription factor n=1 Tax=Paenibacillus radicis (ex Xue et al. 2023) TaxID=2972489 RepID=A0ABT1YFF4_9BACL|nr:response regulator transcription factor [Paenibacillus radicis (ex Xue et al. 2023)]MCR8631927.1 response regulator transcription factor [Paenibacillus radicis (ex Xue et al. 2023)]
MDKPFHNSDYTILIADDDTYITELINMYLKSKGFHVLCAATGSEALELVRRHTIHLIVLDIMMPDKDGWAICTKIRETSDLPILMLTAKGESEDKIRGFGIGADDYMVKPFDPNELIARTVSLLRRSYSSLRQLKLPASIRVDNLTIETASRSVYLDNDIVELTPKEYKLLVSFAQHPNQVLERQQLLDLVWGEDYFGDDRVVDVTIKRLREKLSQEKEKSTWSIETVRGAGYKLRTEVQ